MAIVKFVAAQHGQLLAQTLSEWTGYQAITSEAATLLASFAELVSTWGQRTDLVSAKTLDALFEVLFLDAGEMSSLVELRARVVDVGAGAGAPAIPLAIARPDLSFTLVEPRRRRVAFMRTCVGALGLADRVRVVEGRHDAITERFDVAYSRATFSPEEWVAIGATLADVTLVLTTDALKLDVSSDVQQKRYLVPSNGAPRTIMRCR